jgi:hypothetical protein
MGDRFGFSSMPVTPLTDRGGKIADLHVGMVDKDAFEREFQILPSKRRTRPCGFQVSDYDLSGVRRSVALLCAKFADGELSLAI